MLSLFLSAAPAQAAVQRLCSGYSACQNAGYSHSGYASVSAANTMYWRMYGGHNCTNYVAYRLVHSNGMANQRPWNGDGNAYSWGRLNSNKVDQNPTVSSVAWWDANASGAGSTGHVAYVEQVISANEIIISEDNWGGDFHWKRVTRGGPGWPSGFIHFQDIPQGSAKPFGSFDSAQPVLGGVLLRGWAIDPDTNDSIDVHVYSNGVYRGAVRADKHRPDVDAVHGRGAYHGYEYFLGTEFAVGSIKVYAINAGGGDNPELGTKHVAASSMPFGHLDEIVGMDGNVRLRGWALDPDTHDPIHVHIYRDGVGLASVEAFLTRDDVDKVHGRGPKHGFEVLVPAGSGGGTYTIYAINFGAGGNPVIATAAGPPLVTSSPTVSGSAVFGQTLTASPGSWSVGGLGFSYQWIRGWDAIPGATQPTYKLTTADIGKTVSVRVTATGAGLPRSEASSVATATVQPQALSSPPTPTITGTVKVGQTLQANAGTWSPSPVSLTYQWLRDGSNISGATASTYKVAAADAGKKVSVKVTGTKTGHTTASATSASKTVPLQNLTATPVPTIAGTAKVGQTLTAKAGTWAPSPVALKYQWLRNGTAISGATGSTFKLSAADAGKNISVRVSGSKSGFVAVVKTSATTAVPMLKLSGTPTPTITGTVKVGQTLTAKPGSWSPAPVTLKYQWLRNGSSISGATGGTYKVTAADAGKSLSVKVTGTKAGYSSVAKTSAGKNVPLQSLTVAPAPTITGTGSVGQTLTAKTGAWSPAPVTLSYQWLRNGAPIGGATKSTYKLTTADKGKNISVKVTGSKAGYTSLSKSSSGKQIK